MSLDGSETKEVDESKQIDFAQQAVRERGKQIATGATENITKPKEDRQTIPFPSLEGSQRVALQQTIDQARQVQGEKGPSVNRMIEGLRAETEQIYQEQKKKKEQ